MRRRSRGQPEVPTNINTFRRLPFDQILSYFRDIASGLSHLHSNGFIHRDLKPQNCLLNDTGIPGQHLRVLVSDFGEVQMENSTRNSTGATGTISYCAPEVLKRGKHGGYYQQKCSQLIPRCSRTWRSIREFYYKVRRFLSRHDFILYVFWQSPV